jgi:hypothetical protein
VEYQRWDSAFLETNDVGMVSMDDICLFSSIMMLGPKDTKAVGVITTGYKAMDRARDYVIEIQEGIVNKSLLVILDSVREENW